MDFITESVLSSLSTLGLTGFHSQKKAVPGSLH
jgi:hypothetical protein